MTQVVLGGVYTAKFPYLDSKEDKVRPIIVVTKSFGPYRVIGVVPIFSKPYKEPVDFLVSGWRDTGLVKPSVARVHRFTTLLLIDLGSQLGKLNNSDTNKLKESMREYLGL